MPILARLRPSSDLVETVIVSYGDGHHDAPRGNALRIDTRPLHNPASDPAVRERMLDSTGIDPHVQAYVRATPGFETIVQHGLDHAWSLLMVPGRRFRVDIHVTGGRGRHRSVVVAEEVAARLRAHGIGVETEHRHIDRPLPDALRDLFGDSELAALRLLAQGRTEVEIAQSLSVRPETAGRLLYRARILLRGRTLPHAIACGYETGLLQPSADERDLDPE
ncbi:P-loop ATPase family protein [Streptomyces sp. KhCrAH-43]|uniref:RapZ C-terminal domain-containing protein n=1 Tax=unclassified Streptomyces TaxID=2593676 RepID=UPI00036B1DE3|nr:MULTISPECIES: RNase adapter RapZ [unclassified Streptomyces]MYS32930.1 hypothetical protein [Streptomyces sp. SID4920]MYX64279.1 hypothetical protein [Streptomyces sp. SID8373]RAJ48673.1 P-loop ATPase family protein [Streptomyces sp. KhCrAH-43]